MGFPKEFALLLPILALVASGCSNAEMSWNRLPTKTITEPSLLPEETPAPEPTVTPSPSTSPSSSPSTSPIDTTPPTATISLKAGQANPTNVSPIEFVVTFSEDIDTTSFTASDITQKGTAPVTFEIITTAGAKQFGIKAIPASDGTVQPKIFAGTVVDLAHNSNTANSNLVAAVVYDTIAPVLPADALIANSGWTSLSCTPVFNLKPGSDSGSGVGSYVLKISGSEGTQLASQSFTSTALPSTYQFCGLALTEGATYNASFLAIDRASNSGSPVTVTGVVDVTPPGPFSVAGVTGGTDVTADSLLESGLVPTFNWTASIGASSYRVSVLDEWGDVICGPVDTSDVTSYSFLVSACTFVAKTNYAVRVAALDSAGNATLATDYAFFTGTRASITLTGSVLSGTYAYNASTSRVFTVANTGDAVATAMSFSGLESPFSFVTTCGDVLYNGVTCTVTVTFKSPGDTGGNVSDLLNVAYYNGASDTALEARQTAAGMALSSTVTPLYSAEPKWLDYVQQATPGLLDQMNPAKCLPTDTGKCIHSGELRKILVQGKTSCAGLKLVESLGAFNWACQQGLATETGVAFYSTGLKPGKGLGDLIQYSGGSLAYWKTNAIAIFDESYKIIESSPTVWWGNPISVSTSNTVLNAATPSTIYYVPSGISLSGIQLGSDSVAIVAPRGGTISFGTAPNCDSSTGSPTPIAQRCLIAGGGRSFTWVEGAYSCASQGGYGLVLMGGRSNRVNEADFTSCDEGVRIGNSNFGVLTGVRTQMNTGDGLRLKSASGFELERISASKNSLNGILLETVDGLVARSLTATQNGESGVLASGVLGSVFRDLLLTNNSLTGWKEYSSSGNTIGHITSSNNAGDGIQLGDSLSQTDRGTVFQALLPHNASNGLLAQNVGSMKYAQIVVTDGYRGITLNSGTMNEFSKNLLVGSNSGGDCFVLTGNGLTGSCGNNGSSSATLITGISLANSFKGSLFNDDPVNTSDSAGSIAGSVLDWLNFLNPFRAWAQDSAMGGSGACSGGAGCRIFDWGLRDEDTMLRYRSADGWHASYFTPGSVCPPGVSYLDVLTDFQSRTFLLNATEIVGNYSLNPRGNQNGLCEAGEGCVYSPNFGAYQGEGDYSARTCSYANSAVPGVTLYGRPNSLPIFTISDAGALSLFDDGRQIRNVSGAIANAAATHAKTSGKWYFEVEVFDYTAPSKLYVGVGQTPGSPGGASMANFPGSDPYAWALELSSANVWNNGTSTGAGVTLGTVVPGLTIGVALDLDTAGDGKLWFRGSDGQWSPPGMEPNHPRNPVPPAAQGLPTSSGISPMLGFDGVSGLSVNFGQRPFKFRVPTGFNRGWYD